jgi:hypothetical protein
LVKFIDGKSKRAGFLAFCKACVEQRRYRIAVEVGAGKSKMERK